ncbi:MAG: hypothetical protein ACRDN0_08995 [Trebonia sp.]
MASWAQVSGRFASSSAARAVSSPRSTPASRGDLPGAVVQVLPRGLWGKSAQATRTTADSWLADARNITGEPADLADDIGRAVLASLHRPRRPRVCPCRVKSPLSRWSKRPDGMPRTSLKITSVTTFTSQYRDERRHRRWLLTIAPGP